MDTTPERNKYIFYSLNSRTKIRKHSAPFG